MPKYKMWMMSKSDFFKSIRSFLFSFFSLPQKFPNTKQNKHFPIKSEILICLYHLVKKNNHELSLYKNIFISRFDVLKTQFFFSLCVCVCVSSSSSSGLVQCITFSLFIASNKNSVYSDENLFVCVL